MYIWAELRFNRHHKSKEQEVNEGENIKRDDLE